MRRVKMVRKWIHRYPDGSEDRYAKDGHYAVSDETYAAIVAAEAGHWEDEDPPWIPATNHVEEDHAENEEAPLEDPVDDNNENLAEDFDPPFEDEDFE